MSSVKHCDVNSFFSVDLLSKAMLNSESTCDASSLKGSSNGSEVQYWENPINNGLPASCSVWNSPPLQDGDVLPDLYDLAVKLADVPSDSATCHQQSSVVTPGGEVSSFDSNNSNKECKTATRADQLKYDEMGLISHPFEPFSPSSLPLASNDIQKTQSYFNETINDENSFFTLDEKRDHNFGSPYSQKTFPGVSSLNSRRSLNSQWASWPSNQLMLESESKSQAICSDKAPALSEYVPEIDSSVLGIKSKELMKSCGTTSDAEVERQKIINSVVKSHNSVPCNQFSGGMCPPLNDNASIYSSDKLSRPFSSNGASLFNPGFNSPVPVPPPHPPFSTVPQQYAALLNVLSYLSMGNQNVRPSFVPSNGPLPITLDALNYSNNINSSQMHQPRHPMPNTYGGIFCNPPPALQAPPARMIRPISFGHSKDSMTFETASLNQFRADAGKLLHSLPYKLTFILLAIYLIIRVVI